MSILHNLISECLLNHKLKRFCGLNIPFSTVSYKVIFIVMRQIRI